VNDDVTGFDVQQRLIRMRVITRLAVAVVVNPRNQVRRAGRLVVFDLEHHGVDLHWVRFHSLTRALSSAPDERVQLPHYATANVEHRAHVCHSETGEWIGECHPKAGNHEDCADVEEGMA